MGNSVSTTNLFSDSSRTRTAEDDEDPALKLVLMGSPRSGKTTFCKQIRFLSGDELTEEDRLLMESVIERNILDNLYLLLKKGQAEDQVLENDKQIVDDFVKSSLANTRYNIFGSENGIDKIRQVWNTGTVKKLWKAKDFHIQDTIEYFIENFDKIKSQDMSFQEYSLMHDRAPGIVKASYAGQLRRRINLSDVNAKMRNKLQNPIFQDVINYGDAIVYFVSLNEFASTGTEQPEHEGIQGSLSFFQEFLRQSTMGQTNKLLLLVFNKTDVLHKELHHFQANQTLVYRKADEETKLTYDGPVLNNGIAEDVVVQNINEYFQKCFETVAREEGVYRTYTYFTSLIDPHEVNRLYGEISKDVLRSLALTS